MYRRHYHAELPDLWWCHFNDSRFEKSLRCFDHRLRGYYAETRKTQDCLQ